jgi:hypothetical protein
MNRLLTIKGVVMNLDKVEDNEISLSIQMDVIAIMAIAMNHKELLSITIDLNNSVGCINVFVKYQGSDAILFQKTAYLFGWLASKKESSTAELRRELKKCVEDAENAIPTAQPDNAGYKQADWAL